jgi:antitoxin VapB
MTTLQIRDERARALAEKLATTRKITMTEAVIQALEGELAREAEKVSLAVRLRRIADDLAAVAGPNSRSATADVADVVGGH